MAKRNDEVAELLEDRPPVTEGSSPMISECSQSGRNLSGSGLRFRENPVGF